MNLLTGEVELLVKPGITITIEITVSIFVACLITTKEIDDMKI